MPRGQDPHGVAEGHRALRQRMIAVARWLKHHYNYNGSKETEDFVARGFEKLAGSDPCAQKMRRNPGELLLLSSRLMRQVFCDELRAKMARRRTAMRQKATLHEQRIGAQPSVDRKIDEARRLALVENVLTQIERKEIPFRFSRHEQMVAAFRLKLQGLSEQAIAAELGIAKGTAHNWIKHVTAFLAKQVARRELAGE
jgi:DNA-directed RNA polymerase specialized sigma24 family protein